MFKGFEYMFKSFEYIFKSFEWNFNPTKELFSGPGNLLILLF